MTTRESIFFLLEGFSSKIRCNSNNREMYGLNAAFYMSSVRVCNTLLRLTDNARAFSVDSAYAVQNFFASLSRLKHQLITLDCRRIKRGPRGISNFWPYNQSSAARYPSSSPRRSNYSALSVTTRGSPVANAKNAFARNTTELLTEYIDGAVKGNMLFNLQK